MRFMNFTNLVHFLMTIHPLNTPLFLLLLQKYLLLLLVEGVHVLRGMQICILNQLLHMIHFLVIALELGEQLPQQLLHSLLICSG